MKIHKATLRRLRKKLAQLLHDQSDSYKIRHIQNEIKQKLKSKVYTTHTDACLKRNFLNIFRKMLSRYRATSLKGKEIINKSISISKKLNHNYVGTEHLLLALITMDNPVLQILKDKDLSYETLVETILIVLGEKKVPEKN